MKLLTKTNLIIAGVALVVLLIAGVLAKDWIGGKVEHFNQWRFDRAVAQKQQEIDTLKGENAKLLEEAKKAYALGEAKELERDAAYAELEKYGTAAKAAAQAQKEAANDFEADKKRIDVDLPLLQRCRDLCASRAEAGFACKPTADAYCQRYAGR